MIKKIIILIIIVVVLIGAWYLLSPLWRDIVRNDASPIDSLSSMTPDEKTAFDEAVKDAGSTIIGMDDAMPALPKTLSSGVFIASAHKVMGTALLIQTEEETILRFEDFETVNGPNLHIYLSSELGGDDFIDIGAIKATKGNVNYRIPETVDTKKYNKVLVWCVPFNVLFSYADLH